MSMYEFYCEYKTKSGHRCGETIFARDSIEAREIIKMRPDFSYLFNSPKKVGQKYAFLDTCNIVILLF